MHLRMESQRQRGLRSVSVMERNMPWGDGLVYTTGLRREISEEGVGRDRLVNMQGINKVSKYIKGNGSIPGLQQKMHESGIQCN